MSNEENPRSKSQDSASDACFAILFIICLIVVMALDRNPYPSFKVESVSVSIANYSVNSSDANLAAEWNIGFSVKNNKRFSTARFQDFDAWVQIISQGSSAKVPVQPFRQHARKRKFLNATVMALMPRHHDSPMEFDVMLRAKYDGGSTVQGICRNMKVGFLPGNETKGIMEGEPRSCVLDSHHE